VSEFNKGKFTQTLKGTLLTYLPDQTFKERQALGRPATPNTNTVNTNIRTPNSAAISENNNSNQPDTEWTNINGTNVLTADLPGETTDEEVPISLNSPQPQPAPEPPTSDGDIDVFAGLSEDQRPSAPPNAGDIDVFAGLSADQQTAGVNSQSQLQNREF
jgi:hypothetical protein